MSNSRVAVAVKDSASLEFDGCRLEGNEFGIVCHIDNPSYTYPALRLEGCGL